MDVEISTAQLVEAKREHDAVKMRACRAAWRAKNKGYRSPTAKPRKFYEERWLASATPEEIVRKKAETAEKARAWRIANPERESATRAAYHAANRKEANRARKTRYEANREAHAAVSRVWVAANRVRVQEYKSGYYEANQEKLKQKTRDWNKAHPGHLRFRRATDLAFAIEQRLRTRLAKALRAQGAVRASGTMALVGCSPKELHDYIEAQFAPGMTWENRSAWHLDHKLPCKHFDLTDPSQQAACFHFSNLQPLWAKANRQKSAKVLTQYLLAA